MGDRRRAGPSAASPPPRGAEGPEVFEVQVGSETLVVISLPDEPEAILSCLSRAEREVALGVLRGLSNEAVACQRRSSARTVANQLASIYRKLGISSRAELAAWVGTARPFRDR